MVIAMAQEDTPTSNFELVNSSKNRLLVRQVVTGLAISGYYRDHRPFCLVFDIGRVKLEFGNAC